MIRFLITGLLRDKSRSRMPILVVAIGVTLTVFMHAYVTGFMGDSIELNARFTSGHMKVMTKGYAENMSQAPNDMALIGADALLEKLKTDYPEADWVPRIQFGGLIDVPDASGETRSQGPAMGLALDLLNPSSGEADRLNLEKSMVQGAMIQAPGDALLSDHFAQKLGVHPGDHFTLIGSTMNGSMSFYNFKVVGTVSFGNEVLDRGSIVVDINDARLALDMEDAAGEILGFLKTGYYDNDRTLKVSGHFNKQTVGADDLYVPVMQSLAQQGSMGQYVLLADVWTVYVSMIFVIAMALVLWNAGLLGGLRRYGEFGIRLAMGEEKKHVYFTLIYEAVAIGIIGTVVGTGFGLLFSWLLQRYGIDISGMMEGSSIMMPTVMRARITPVDFYLGFIPGLIATVIGSMLAGVGIFKRKTSQLFKELEA